MLQGKKLSILGDSISTYRGISNDATANSSIIYNPYFYTEPFPEEKTYWQIIMADFGLTLCVNNSWSGGNLSGKENPDSGINRARNLSRNDGTNPNLIILFMGINDLGRGVPVTVFESDYRNTLKTIKKLYPFSHVCCVNLPDRDIFMKDATELFNSAIERSVRSCGENFFIADLFHSRLNNHFYYMNTLDGLHPDEDGMKIIAEVLEKAIRASLL